MKQSGFYTVIIFVLFSVLSCSNKHEAAQKHLEQARTYLSLQDFDKAKAELDSINKLYPRSFDQRQASIPLLDSIRRAENEFNITNIDKQLAEVQPLVEEMKKDFIYQIDKKYQETGIYNPKFFYNQGIYSQTTLHAGVEEDGRVFLKSIYLGGQKHNQLKASAGDSSAETLITDSDGFRHTFTDLGKTYEIITFIGPNENDVAKFIAENYKSNIKITLSGQHTTSYTLNTNAKDAIKKSYELSSKMLLVDSLKEARKQIEFFEYYLDNGKQLNTPIDGEQSKDSLN